MSPPLIMRLIVQQVRVWMQSQMVVDPLMGVLFWATFMQAIKVLTWVPGEPRRAVPHDTIEAIIDLVEARYLHDLFAVQMVFLILVLYYSFSRRSECPCPKTYTGRECFDEDVHWGVPSQVCGRYGSASVQSSRTPGRR